MLRCRWSPTRRGSVLAACLALLPACVLSRVSFGGELAGADAVAAIEPGHTTCEQVLDLLGPPEEYAQPVPLVGLRAWDPQDQRVLEERDIFRRRTWSWVREERSDRVVWVPPLFAWTSSDAQADRIVVTFDAKGVVTAVGADRAAGAP